MYDSPFEEWFNGMVGFHINSERIRDDIGGIGDGVDSTALEKWMRVCWNQAIEAAVASWDEEDASNIEALKA
jgi:hypothetical protein